MHILAMSAEVNAMNLLFQQVAEWWKTMISDC